MRKSMIFRAWPLIALALLPFASPAQGDDDDKAPEDRVLMVVCVPTEDAQLLISGEPTKTTGTVRRLVSPPLIPGEQYTYTFQAKWKENGKEMHCTCNLMVQAGHTAVVNINGAMAHADGISTTSNTPETPATAKPRTAEAIKTPPVESAVAVKKEPVPEPAVKPDPEIKKEKLPAPAPEPVTKKEPIAPTTGKDPALPAATSTVPAASEKAPPQTVVSKRVPTEKLSMKLDIPSTLFLQVGGFSRILPIKLDRAGVEGPVKVKFENLPTGVSIKEATIPAGESRVDVVPSLSRDAEVGQTEVKVIAEAGDSAKSEFTLTVKISK